MDPVFFKKLAQAQLGLLVFTDILRAIYLVIVNRLNLLLLAGRSVIEIFRIVDDERLRCLNVFRDLNVCVFTLFT